MEDPWKVATFGYKRQRTKTNKKNKQKTTQKTKKRATRTPSKILLFIRHPLCYSYIQVISVKVMAVREESKHLRIK